MADTTEKTAPAWRKSSFCNGAGACVRVRLRTASVVEVRDEHGARLDVPVGAWWSLLAAVKSGQLSWYGGTVQLVRVGPDDWRMWLTSDDTARLSFTEAEIAAFVDGVNRRKFDLASLSTDPDARARAQKVPTAGEDASPVSV